MFRKEPLPLSSKLANHSSSYDDEDGGCPLQTSPSSSDDDDDDDDANEDINTDANNKNDNNKDKAPTEPHSKPLPRPHDLYSHGKAVLERIEQLRAIYRAMLDLEAKIANNLVQDLRGEMKIEWIRRDDHEEAIGGDRNLQTIRELRCLLVQRDEEIDLLKQQLDMVDGATQKRPARLSFDNNGGGGGGDGADGQGPRVRLTGYSGQNREKGAPGARTLLSREFKSWR